MAPEICRESSDLGRRRLRPRKPNRHVILQSRAHLARSFTPTRPSARARPTHGIRLRHETVNSRVHGGVRAATMGACAPTSSSGEAPWWTGRAPAVVPPTSPSPAAGSATSAPASRASACSTQPARSCRPGFVDIHTHYDAQVFWDPDLTPSSFHGVTTVIAGNCGFSIAPIRADGVSLLARTLQHVEDMSFDTLAAGVPWDEFETFPQYLDAVAARGVALNYGCYVGHTAVRLYVMGEDAYERAATDGRDRPDAGRGRRRHGGRRGRLRLERVADPQRRQRPARARPGWPTWPSCAPCSSRSSSAGAAWWRCCRAASSPTRRSSGSSARWGDPSPGRRCSR